MAIVTIELTAIVAALIVRVAMALTVAVSTFVWLERVHRRLLRRHLTVKRVGDHGFRRNNVRVNTTITSRTMSGYEIFASVLSVGHRNEGKRVHRGGVGRRSAGVRRRHRLQLRRELQIRLEVRWRLRVESELLHENSDGRWHVDGRRWR